MMTTAAAVLAEIAAFDYCWPGFGSIDYSKTLLLVDGFTSKDGRGLRNDFCSSKTHDNNDDDNDDYYQEGGFLSLLVC